MLDSNGPSEKNAAPGTGAAEFSHAEELHETDVPTSRKLPPPGQDPLRAKAGILSELAGKRLWMAIAGFLLLTNLATPIILVQLLLKPQLVIALDGANTFHVGPGSDYAASEEVMNTHGVLSSMALLQRSEIGFDLPEILSRLFTRTAGEKAKAQMESELEGMKERKERWRPEVASVELVRVDDGKLFVLRANGQLIKSGVAAGGRYETAQEFSLILRLIKNHDMMRNARYPLVVYDYELNISSEARAQNPSRPPDAVDEILKRQQARETQP